MFNKQNKEKYSFARSLNSDLNNLYTPTNKINIKKQSAITETVWKLLLRIVKGSIQKVKPGGHPENGT